MKTRANTHKHTFRTGASFCFEAGPHRVEGAPARGGTAGECVLVTVKPVHLNVPEDERAWLAAWCMGELHSRELGSLLGAIQKLGLLRWEPARSELEELAGSRDSMIAGSAVQALERLAVPRATPEECAGVAVRIRGVAHHSKELINLDQDTDEHGEAFFYGLREGTDAEVTVGEEEEGKLVLLPGPLESTDALLPELRRQLGLPMLAAILSAAPEEQGKAVKTTLIGCTTLVGPGFHLTVTLEQEQEPSAKYWFSFTSGTQSLAGCRVAFVMGAAHGEAELALRGGEIKGTCSVELPGVSAEEVEDRFPAQLWVGVEDPLE